MIKSQMFSARTSLFLFATLLMSIVLSADDAFAQKGETKKDDNDESLLILLKPEKFYKKYLPNLKIKRNPPDSNYIKTYPNYLTTGVHVLSPAIGMNLQSKKHTSGFNCSSQFRTNISDIVGISAGYRFISFGFAFLLKSGINMHDNYAASRYRTATIKYSNAAYSFQFKYLRIKGFTDINQPDQANLQSPYTLKPDMLNKEFQFEGVYNLSWKKYLYAPARNFAQRQVRSRGGFLLKPGVYYNQLSSDTPLINQQQQTSLTTFKHITALRMFSVRIAPGFGGNLVLRKNFYFSIAAFPSVDLYFYKLLQSHDTNARTKNALAFVFDGKASIAYQSKRFYAGVRYEYERRAISLRENVQLNNSYTYAGIEAGYRFNTPRFVRKIYKKTMPPGM